MEERLNYAKATPGYRAMAALQSDVYDCGLEPLLLELVKMRASQVNGWNRLAIGFRSQPGSTSLQKSRFLEPLLLVAIGRFPEEASQWLYVYRSWYCWSQ